MFMRIAYITAGAADMYCGSCLHDNTLAAALIKQGHEVALIPTYTLPRTDEPNVSLNHVFYGGINVYLQHKLSLFRHTPRVLDALLDRPALLGLVSRFASTTDAKGLGSLTVSILKGKEGHQRKELIRLIQWMQDSVRPEIVELTNSMFLGLAREIKRKLKVPVLCALQGEDIFLENLTEPYKSQVKELLRTHAADVDGFIATSAFYADFMADYLDIDRQKVHVVRLGLNLKDHGAGSPPERQRPFVIGYLARICPEKGLHLLVEAFHELSRRLNSEQIQLKVAGYLGSRDNAYLRNVVDRISGWSLKNRFDYWGEVDRRQKIRFLNSLHVLSVPTVYQEPKGLYLLEALANGVPVVQPSHGAFPELIEETGGGILVEPNSVTALAQGIQTLIEDSSQRERLGNHGKKMVRRAFNDQILAEATLAVYRRYL